MAEDNVVKMPAPAEKLVEKAYYDVMSTGMTRSSLMREVGTSSLRQTGGYITEEFLPQLQGEKGAKIYREMADNSASIGSLLFTVTQIMRKVEWKFVPPNESRPAKAKADWCKTLLDDMEDTWEEFVVEMLSMLVFGFAPMEIVLKKRDGKGSKNSDGTIGIRKLPLRSQDSVSNWLLGDHDEFQGFIQQPWNGPTVTYLKEKILLFRPSHSKNNPEGRSILRNCYRSWYYLKRLEEMQSILFERMSGFPLIYVPEELATSAAEGDVVSIAKLNAYKAFVTRTRVNDQMGGLLFSDTYPDEQGRPTTVPKYKFEFAVPNVRVTGDYEAAKRAYRIDILASALADFIDLGHDSRGTQSLAVSKVDLFLSACEGWLKSAAAVIDRDLLTVLWKLNGFDMKIKPTIVPEMPKQIDLVMVGDFIQKISAGGAQLFPDVDLENWLRDQAGMPEMSEEAKKNAETALTMDYANNPPAPPGAVDASGAPVATPAAPSASGASGGPVGTPATYPDGAIGTT